MKMKLTTDWILINLTSSLVLNKGIVQITSDIDNYHWIVLALDTLNIKYTNDEYVHESPDGDMIFTYVFEFPFEDLEEGNSPELYEYLKKSFPNGYVKNLFNQ